MGRNSALEGPAFDTARDLLRLGYSIREVQARVMAAHGETFSLHRIGSLKGAVVRDMKPARDKLLEAIVREHPYIFRQESA